MRRTAQSVVDVLIARIAALKTDDTLWTMDLQDDYNPTEIARHMAEFRAHPPVAVKGYPRTDAKFPRWCVVLYGSTADGEFCGGGSTGQYTSESTPREVFEILLTQRIGIEVYIENSQDACELHALLAFKAILAGLDAFHTAGLEARLCGGMEDLHPLQRNLPDSIYIRAQAWEFPGSVATVAAMESGLVSGPARVAMNDMAMDDDGTLGMVDPIEQDEL